MSITRVIFMGTPSFAVPALEALAGSYDVIAAYSQPPRPAGRGYDIKKSPVHETAEIMNIPVFTPRTFKDVDVQKQFADLKADVAVVAAYGLILPVPALNAPKYGCINIHASLLPRWRGASPIQHAIWKGDTQSGLTIMRMEAGLDTGPMLLKDYVSITPETTTPMLHDALSAMGGKLIIKTLQNIDTILPTKQDDSASTYAPMLKKEMGQIDWSHSADDIDRQIRALNPWPGTYTNVNGKRLKILSATPTIGDGDAGKVLNRAGAIACGSGALQLQQIQPDGGKAMDAASAINGNIFKAGDTLA
jgi:methionyl-tRNA formyltransferase